MLGIRGSRATRSRRGLGTIAAVAAVTGGLLVGCTPPTHGGGTPSQGAFSLLTYNVAGLPQELSQENPSEHIPLISPLLNDYDVVVTQEDFDWWTDDLAGLDFVHYHERLRADATHPYQSARWLGPEAAGIDPALREAPFVGDGLGVLSRLPFSGETRRAWHDCFGGLDTSDGGAADCLAGKGFGVVTMTLGPGQLVDVYTLHGEAGSTPEDERLKADDYDQLAEFIREHSQGRAIVLAGDTNLHTDADGPEHVAIWEEFLRATELVDACATLDCAEPGSIDKIAYRSGGGVDLTPTTLEFPRERFRDASGEDLSDHPPVTADFDWRAGRH